MMHLLDENNVWAYTRLELPVDAPSHYYNVFTAANLSAKVVDDHQEMNIQEVLGAFPVAQLLVR